MMSGDETESVFAVRVARALRDGTAGASTPEARARVMDAIRAAAPPVRDADDGLSGDGLSGDSLSGARWPDVQPADVVPLGLTSSGTVAAAGVAATSRRRFWRSPAFALLAAASIAAVVALVRAVGVDGPIPAVPGQRAVASRGAAAGPAAPAAAGAATQPVGAGQVRTAQVQFVLVAPAAHRVAVVGDFNDWDSAAAPLESSGGVWSRQLDIPLGRHDYAFVVDGERWMRDPNAPQAPADEFGSGYSVLVVGENPGGHR